MLKSKALTAFECHLLKKNCSVGIIKRNEDCEKKPFISPADDDGATFFSFFSLQQQAGDNIFKCILPYILFLFFLCFLECVYTSYRFNISLQGRNAVQEMSLIYHRTIMPCFEYRFDMLLRHLSVYFIITEAVGLILPHLRHSFFSTVFLFVVLRMEVDRNPKKI